MPNYGQVKRTFSKSQGKWVTKRTEQSFDYDNVDNADSVALLLSFFRFYPDIFADIFRSENAQFQLELPQRLLMRVLARYRDSFISSCRGLGKTYCLILAKMIEGALYPGEIMRYAAPNQKQAAALATQAYHQIEKDYPDIASMWQLKNDRSDMFRITTQYGSEFSMYAPRGSNASQSVAEEIGQETPEPFDLENYEKNILPTVRLTRYVNKRKDHTHINLKHSHITNASSRQNKAFTEHRYNTLKTMLYGDKYEGYVLDMSWVSALISGIRDKNYIKDQKSKLTAENFLREMCARYTGTGDSPMLTDETISKSRKLKIMEERHCGDKDAIYIVAHDVAYENLQHNAKCADVVIKCTKYTTATKRDKYRKQVVFVDNYPPPPTAYLQAKKTKELWARFCLDGGQMTYLVVDARAVGKDVVDELMKPMHDGLPPLSCTNGFNASIEQPNAIRCLYPLKASRGGADDEVAMIEYYRSEFEQGNVELLTSDIRGGLEQYKIAHSIKDDMSDTRIVQPYKRTDELCQQIANLKVEPSGTGIREKRKSIAIQRDTHSALKYGLRIARELEEKLKKQTYKAKSSWSRAIESGIAPTQTVGNGNAKATLLGLRKR